MPSSQQPFPADTTAAAPYRSTACRIGTHSLCTESSPASAPVDLPLIYERCGCPCHSTCDQATLREGQR